MNAIKKQAERLTKHPKISVCIPAYNRASLLPELLDSVFSQEFDDYEVLITEDFSPERDAIRAVAINYADRYPGKLRYEENPVNFGYDGNLRNIIRLAQGDYVFFMGNDDLMAPGALARVGAALARHSDVGVVLRTYAVFDGSPDNIVETFRYFDQERFFPAGVSTIATIYRRAVVIPGMVLHRESALKYASDRFDGTLLYQLYLVAEILTERNAVFLPDVSVLYRSGGTPDFGNSAAEQGKFTPKEQTPESSLHFVKGMLEIAEYVGQERRIPIYPLIFKDLANYSYPLLAIQASKPPGAFLKYGWGLRKMGFGRYPLFWAYWLALLVLGVKRVNRLIGWIKARLGRTPVLGNVYQGTKQ
jgi:abequosyltransferase